VVLEPRARYDLSTEAVLLRLGRLARDRVGVLPQRRGAICPRTAIGSTTSLGRGEPFALGAALVSQRTARSLSARPSASRPRERSGGPGAAIPFTSSASGSRPIRVTFCPGSPGSCLTPTGAAASHKLSSSSSKTRPPPYRARPFGRWRRALANAIRRRLARIGGALNMGRLSERGSRRRATRHPLADLARRLRSGL
jgi:hypothetical protein